VTVLERVRVVDSDLDDDAFLLIVALLLVVLGLEERDVTRPLSESRELRVTLGERLVAWLLVRVTALRPDGELDRVLIVALFVAALLSVVLPLLMVWRVPSVLVRELREVTTAGPDAVITRRGVFGLFCTTERRPMDRRASGIPLPPPPAPT
jgi:hypothetical protein